MEEFKGKPGPWHWQGRVLCNNAVIIGGDGWAFNDADKKLIAAAPDLLETLQELLALYEHDEGCRNLTEYKRAKAAIAKALGK